MNRNQKNQRMVSVTWWVPLAIGIIVVLFVMVPVSRAIAQPFHQLNDTLKGTSQSITMSPTK
jgi:hypothetical protein